MLTQNQSKVLIEKKKTLLLTNEVIQVGYLYSELQRVPSV